MHMFVSMDLCVFPYYQMIQNLHFAANLNDHSLNQSSQPSSMQGHPKAFWEGEKQ